MLNEVFSFVFLFFFLTNSSVESVACSVRAPRGPAGRSPAALQCPMCLCVRPSGWDRFRFSPHSPVE